MKPETKESSGGSVNAPPRPSPEDCSAHVVRTDPDGRKVLACWSPQMGGYVGECVVTWFPDRTAGIASPCFEAYVWHDGEFPLADGEPPRALHHCDPGQFVRFGEVIAGAMRGT